jgi:hypothetical protein
MKVKNALWLNPCKRFVLSSVSFAYTHFESDPDCAAVAVLELKAREMNDAVLALQEKLFGETRGRNRFRGDCKYATAAE